MKTEGEERANLSSQILKMSLDYHFVTPLTSMTIRGLTDEDGLEPIIDKPPEGTGIGGSMVSRCMSQSPPRG